MVELFRHQKWGCPGCLWGKSVLGASQACSVNILLTYIYPLVPVSLSASIGDDSSLRVGWVIQRQYTFDSVWTRTNVLIRYPERLEISGRDITGTAVLGLRPQGGHVEALILTQDFDYHVEDSVPSPFQPPTWHVEGGVARDTSHAHVDILSTCDFRLGLVIPLCHPPLFHRSSAT